MAATETTPLAGYTQLDGKGRPTLGKPIRDALHLEAGSTLAWLMVGDTLVLVPDDTQLAELMEAAATTSASMDLNLDDLDEELARIRDGVVMEHNGPDFFR